MTQKEDRKMKILSPIQLISRKAGYACRSVKPSCSKGCKEKNSPQRAAIYDRKSSGQVILTFSCSVCELVPAGERRVQHAELQRMWFVVQSPCEALHFLWWSLYNSWSHLFTSPKSGNESGMWWNPETGQHAAEDEQDEAQVSCLTCWNLMHLWLWRQNWNSCSTISHESHCKPEAWTLEGGALIGKSFPFRLQYCCCSAAV